ncbi:hypothetical protein LBMAG15_19250 [Actinomycetes bacterium]|nr:hypothetical protein LBMAG15_19250 [Actinomycetes bacterium]
MPVGISFDNGHDIGARHRLADQGQIVGDGAEIDGRGDHALIVLQGQVEIVGTLLDMDASSTLTGDHLATNQRHRPC